MHHDGDERARRTFRIATMPGVIVSKWTRVWAERRPTTPLELIRTGEHDQVSVLHEDRADVSFVRLPVEQAGLSLIPLYTEVPVVVLPTDHELAVLDAVCLADLADEHLVRVTGATGSIRDAVALVAAGVGVLLVPMSVARMHHRKDVTHRPVTDAEPTQIGLAWTADRTTADIEEFVGIVRGRTARSSRASPDAGPETNDAASAERSSDAPRGRAQGPARDGRRKASDPRGRRNPGPPRGRRRGKR